MNNKLSSPVINQLSFLTLKELQNILEKFHDGYDSDRYDTWKHLAKTYTDEQITPLLNKSPECKSNDTRTKEEKLQELRGYYVKSNDTINVTANVTANDMPSFRRGRKKQETTLKDRVFTVLDENLENKRLELDYKGVLESGIVDIAENTFKTILSQWRKEKGIKVKRGRKSNG